MRRFKLHKVIHHLNFDIILLQFQLACMVTDEFDDVVRTLPCPQTGDTCGNEEWSEMITIDDEDLVAYFCKPSRQPSSGEDGDSEEVVFDVKDHVCITRRPSLF